MSGIEVFAEIVCPFTHVGLRRLLDAADDARRRPPRARPRVAARADQQLAQNPDVLAREIEALRVDIAPDLFKGFDPARLPRTSLPAFGLAAVAYERRGDAVGEAVSLALRDAVFEDGLDVGDPDVIITLAERFGLEAPSARYTDVSVRADWHRGVERRRPGITALLRR